MTLLHMAVIVGTFLCLIFLAFHECLGFQALICNITWCLEIGKTIKIKDRDSKTLLGGLGGDVTCNPRKLATILLSCTPPTRGRVMGRRSVCQYFHQEVLRGSLGAVLGHKNESRYWPSWTDYDKCSEGRGQSVMKGSPRSRDEASLLWTGR